MDRIWRLTVELRRVSWDSDDMEFAVIERIRTASPRPVCTLQIGNAVDMDSIGLLQQILDDCMLSATGRTVGAQHELVF